jgi:hypothetical protein
MLWNLGWLPGNQVARSETPPIGKIESFHGPRWRVTFPEDIAANLSTNPETKHFPGISPIFIPLSSIQLRKMRHGAVVPFRMRVRIMTNRRDFLRTSGLMVAAAAFTVNPAKEAEAAIFDETRTEDFIKRVRVNQQKLTAELKQHYDFIVCGWEFKAQPNSALHERALSMSMGKVLGGGSSVNGMYWVRGHKNDWNYFADEAGDAAWNYESVLNIYRRIEDWQGESDPKCRGTGGLVYVRPSLPTSPIGPAIYEGARAAGIPSFENLNGRMMEGGGGCSSCERRIRDGRRLSVFRTYTFPYMDRSNLTVLTQAMVTRLTLEGKRATGVEVAHAGKVLRIGAKLEVVLSLARIIHY